MAEPGPPRARPDPEALRQAAWPDLFANLQMAYSELTQAQFELERRTATIEEMRELFERVVESMADALILVDRAGRIVRTNAAARRLLGDGGGRLEGVPFDDVSPVPEIPGTPKALLDRAADGVLRNLDIEVGIEGGVRVPVSVSCAVVRDPHGKITGLLIVARDITERRQAERRTAVLHTVTRVLAESAGFDDAGPRILKAICDGLDWQIGEIWQHDGERGVLRRSHVWFSRPDYAAFVDASSGVVISPGEGIPGRVYRGGEAEWIPQISGTEQVTRAGALRDAGLRAAAAVPLRLRAEVTGVLVFFSEEAREPDGAMLDVLRSLGSQVGQFIERKQAEAEREALLVRLYQHEHEIAETLQRSLLPQHLPSIPGLALAARYLPGTAAAVGGDWYDVFPLPAGQIGMVMGDVAGRGVRAAAVMGQLRNAMRAYAHDGPSPAEVARRLNHLIDLGEMATLVYLIYDPVSHLLRYVNAGHLPPLVLAPSGAVRRLEAGSPPLGGLATASYAEDAVGLATGSTVLMYTDGLVEVKRVGVDEGMARLEQMLAAWGGADLDMLLEQIVSAMLGTGRPPDDVALLSLRVETLDAPHVQLRLPAVPASVGNARRAVQRWLEAQGVAELKIFEVGVALSEAGSNAVEHAYGAADADIEVTARREDDEIVVRVRDWGRWRPARGAFRGRGMAVMEQLMDAVSVQTESDGTTVELRRRIGGGTA